MRFAQMPLNQAAHQEALMRQLSAARTSPTQQLLAHEMAMMRMANPQYNNQVSMEDLARLEATRMAARQGSPLVSLSLYLSN